ncbi:phenylalanine--tRNA ligase subunit beta [Candidatus Berkiella aquae]|uniref:Phenylalanine--tRNA ligase beta subunit n=1 Tax=Candidatus Berkiella aquae TaxID=295108 RepID=A0A0Q9Z0E2_9GAMM|nr:phenylalanine--tRNA ligase subunit beta [Candidatus Berkiella aquae]MCS5711905.1 phenylalanine--tRNA ligase subunit beta [Candidatus Berkiella aquae]
MKFSEKWLREWVNPSLTTEQLSEQLTMAGLEVDSVEKTAQDTLIEVDLTPNRGDCLSILGIAREVAALNKLNVTAHKIPTIKPSIEKTFEVEIQAQAECPRYVGRLVRDIRQDAVTPAWLVEHLAASDIGSLHPVVDILNFVMLELGQPMHAFDADKLSGTIEVRLAKKNETIKLLDQQKVILQPDTLVIADQKAAHAMAGIMGGFESAVSESTVNLFLESALFSAELIAGKARRYGLHTDSSFRFERGVDPQLQTQAIERATHLILEICGGNAGPITEVQKPEFLPKQAKIVLHHSRVQKMLGESLAPENVKEILHRMGCKVIEGTHKAEDKQWEVLPPSYRYDLNGEIDLVEEVVRIIGYNNVPTHAPLAHLEFIKTPQSQVPVSRIKRALVDLGYQEVITYSFVDDNLQKQLFPQQSALPLLNPISADMGVMRVSLWPGLLSTLIYNQNRQQTRLKIFEVGMCFHQHKDKLEQKNWVGGLISGTVTQENWDGKPRIADFFDAKLPIEHLWHWLGHKDKLTFVATEHSACHPGQCAAIQTGNQVIGTVGRLHPRIQKELGIDHPVYLFEMEQKAISLAPMLHFERPSKFPEIRRDIAVIVDEKILGADLINYVRKSADSVLREISIFDVYAGKGIDSGRKSIAIGLILQHPSRTLVDQEVDEIILSIVNGLEKEFSAKLRD